MTAERSSDDTDGHQFARQSARRRMRPAAPSIMEPVSGSLAAKHRSLRSPVAPSDSFRDQCLVARRRSRRWVAFLDVPSPLANMTLTSCCSGPNRRFWTLVRALHPALRGMTSPTCAAEQLDRFPVECRDIIGAAARDQVLVHDRFLVHPVRSGILEVGFERGP